MLMEDDRDRYLAEIIEQADGLADYIIAFIGASRARYPWTIELINCGLAIGNIAYFHYKSQFKRVRPSTLCPGLTPPYGPPAHPAFISGHSFLGHLVTLLLLEIPALRQRYGMSGGPVGSLGLGVDPYPRGTISVNTPAAGSPAIITLAALTAHGLRANDNVVFQPAPATPSQPLPPPITAGTTYYVLPTGLTCNSFQISGTPSPPFPDPPLSRS